MKAVEIEVCKKERHTIVFCNHGFPGFALSHDRLQLAAGVVVNNIQQNKLLPCRDIEYSAQFALAF